jgi:hypothetical protein
VRRGRRGERRKRRREWGGEGDQVIGVGQKALKEEVSFPFVL